ncbi:MAG: Ribosomal RNA small subunit methyltransferase H [Firmicutes bacterium ADurb.Bin182]|nr:MAG: Ribosomal RNA small subunit methyltransferase H [Firmicutes bacterium ADurb.Bin182]
MKPEYSHTPIMPGEVLQLLKPEKGGLFVDCTLGGGGHAEAILSVLPEGSRLIGIDRDRDAIEAASCRLKKFGTSFIPVRGNFFNIKKLMESLKIESVDGILMDLGVSSYQLDNPQRGFSYHADAPLDMRMDASQAFSAFDVVNGYPKTELIRIIRNYGEERFASRIAERIIGQREIRPIKSTAELSDIIKSAVPGSSRWDGTHPARRTFQAIRIEVNDELAGLENALRDSEHLLNRFGRMVVITFHSLEDRIVKQTFRSFENPCICSPDAPVCVCGRKATSRTVNKKPVTAGEEEIKINPRSRSAKLRAIEKL